MQKNGRSLASEAAFDGVLRPENLRVFPSAECLPEGWLSLPAKVSASTYVGGTSNIYMVSGDRSLHARSYGLLPEEIRDDVEIIAGFDPADIHILEG